MPKRYTPRRKAPFRKKGKRNYRKGGRKVFKKIKRREKPTSVIIKQPSGLPDRLFVKLKYTEFLTWTQTLGTLSSNIYRGNSLFDPDLTGTGGQPYLFDQWSALYNNYRVHGCKVRFEMTGNGGGVFNCVRMGITPSTQSSTFGASGQELIQEQPRSKWRMWNMGAASVGQGIVKHYISTRQAIGLNKAGESDQDYQATVTANPAKQWYFHCWCYTPDGNTIAASSSITLTYFAEFYNRAAPALS